MPDIATQERLRQTLSLALEDRSRNYEDLVSNSNVLWYIMKENGMLMPFEGPTIRQTVQFDQTGTYTRYRGADFLSVTRTNLFNDAEWLPFQMAVTVSLTMDEILKNKGAGQLLDLMSSYMEASEVEIQDRWTEDLHSAGLQANQIEGLQAAIPSDPTVGTYGSIDRATVPIWRTGAFNVSTNLGGLGTTFTANNAQQILLLIVIQTTRNKRGPDCVLMSTEHYQAYSAAITAIQRINDENELGKIGFSNLKFYGAGRSIDIVLEGGIGTAMPSTTSYGINKESMRYRYIAERHFTPFGGPQTPINQDLIVQHIGCMGNLTQKNPIFNFKMFGG